MIFNSNTTSLGTSVPMAEGYDCSYGAALALVESARNDYAMFRAMLDVDAREIQIQRESAGYVTEGQIVALAEAATGGIWNKIKELFQKLAAKIKTIFNTFMSKIRSLYTSDKQMVKKYEKELYRKTHLGNLQVKWVKYKPNYTSDALDTSHKYELDKFDGWNDDADERMKYFLLDGISPDDFNSDMDDKFADGGEASTEDLKDVGGIRAVCNFLSSYEKDLRELERKTKDLVKTADNLAKDADKKAKEKIDAARGLTKKTGETLSADDQANNAKIDAVDDANKSFDMATAYQDVVLKATQWVLNTKKTEYKQYKAAFMKAIAADDKKLESTLLEAVGEAAEQEVDSVIDRAISKEELSELNKANTNVIDSDVSDDYDKLTYGPDKYTDDYYGTKAGSVDTNINSKSESAFFGKLFY